MMFIILLWLAFALIVANVAEKRGRSKGWFFVWSVVLSPIVGLILVLALSKRNRSIAEIATAGTQRKASRVPLLIVILVALTIIGGHMQRERDNAPANEKQQEMVLK